MSKEEDYEDGYDDDESDFEDEPETIVGNPEPAPDQMKRLVEHLQKENNRLTDQNQRLQKMAVDIREDKFELEKFIADKIYPALEGQTALNIAALEALQERLEDYYGVVDQQANPVIQ